jgi:hypothetical protein
MVRFSKTSLTGSKHGRLRYVHMEMSQRDVGGTSSGDLLPAVEEWVLAKYRRRARADVLRRGEWILRNT